MTRLDALKARVARPLPTTLVIAREDIKRLVAVVEVARRLDSPHGPVTHSSEWQAAWNHLGHAIAYWLAEEAE